MPARLLLDACVAINLIATQKLDEIAEANGFSFMMVSEAAAEVSSLRTTVDGERIIVPVSVAEYTRSGSLEFTELTEDELPLFVDYAAKLDDGEAATMAVAVSRSLPLATDDKAALRLCTEMELPQPTCTSALLRKYSMEAGLTPKEVQRILHMVNDQASFMPPRTDPEHTWWMEHLQLEQV